MLLLEPPRWRNAYIVDKCPNLLGIANGPHALIPVVMALTHNSNSIAMAQYLLSKTDLKILSPGKDRNGATFLLLDAFIPKLLVRTFFFFFLEDGKKFN